MRRGSHHHHQQHQLYGVGSKLVKVLASISPMASLSDMHRGTSSSSSSSNNSSGSGSGSSDDLSTSLLFSADEPLEDVSELAATHDMTDDMA